jgi:hypothetical protein
MQSTPHRSQRPRWKCWRQQRVFVIQNIADSHNENAGVWTLKKPADVSTFKRVLDSLRFAFEGRGII